MLDANKILSQLTEATNTNTVLLTDKQQTISAIKKNLISIHNLYKPEYDKIAKYFIGDTPYDTCENIYNFLRANVYNETETKSLQTVRSPYLIITTGRTMGADCKNYALFTAGVLDAVNRSGKQYIPFCFRFAKYRNYDILSDSYRITNHVFVIAFPGTKNDIWIDPIDDVPYFDYRRRPHSYSDKKIKYMALVHMSGFGKPEDPHRFTIGLMMERNRMISRGRIYPGDDIDREYKAALAGMGVMGWDDAALAALPYVISWFSSKPNPNDWQGWKNFGDAKHWTITDGDSVENEALNIISFIGAHGVDGMLKDGDGVRAVTLQEIASKLTKGGYPNEAAMILKLKPGGIVTANPFPNPSNPNPTEAGMGVGTMLLIGGAALGAAKMFKLF